MKNRLQQTLVVLILFSLVACQTPATTDSTVTEFFKGEAGRSLSLTLPTGWVAKLGGTDITPLIIVTDNWEKYQNKDTNTETLGIIIVPLSDKGTAEQVLGVSVKRLKDVLIERKGQAVLETREGQAYASEEYVGQSLQDGAPLYYFLTVIATGTRSVLVFTSVTTSQQETMRLKYQKIVKAIRLH